MMELLEVTIMKGFSFEIPHLSRGSVAEYEVREVTNLEHKEESKESSFSSLRTYRKPLITWV